MPDRSPRSTQRSEQDEATLQSELNEIGDTLGTLYRRRDQLLEALAELRGSYELPPPSRRTATQQAIASCPRCSGRIEVGATASQSPVVEPEVVSPGQDG